jgi:hypothetical protein
MHAFSQDYKKMGGHSMTHFFGAISMNNEEKTSSLKTKIPSLGMEATKIGERKGIIPHLFSFKPFRACSIILYYFGLISAFFFMIWKWPNSAATLSYIIIIVFLVMVIIPVIRRNLASLQMGKSTRAKFFIKTTVDVSGIILTAAAAILLAGASARYFAPRIGTAVEASSPGLGASIGIFSGLLIAAIVGLCVGYLVRAIWIRLTKLLV